MLINKITLNDLNSVDDGFINIPLSLDFSPEAQHSETIEDITKDIPVRVIPSAETDTDEDTDTETNTDIDAAVSTDTNDDVSTDTDSES